MSFEYNPFNHIEVVEEPKGNYQLYCSECGERWGVWRRSAPISIFFRQMAIHVRDFHRISKFDARDWSNV